ncbi:MAG: hypothetical protein IPK73_19865 [Candidatus Obscuribacter sp.]|nr:hypothetical protein [Candidatus Obscuribacter sp.]MBK9278109.1 hypothetical protein [Candidatus Obscuribacter sp.]
MTQDELIELLAELDPSSMKSVALDILKLDESFQEWDAIGLAGIPTEYLRDLRKHCKTALAQNESILLRIKL